MPFSKLGLRFSGLSPAGKLVEIIELENHPWFVAAQFHPEFKSKPDRPHPLFREFIHHAILRSENVSTGGASSKEEASSEGQGGEKTAEAERATSEVA